MRALVPGLALAALAAGCAAPHQAVHAADKGQEALAAPAMAAPKRVAAPAVAPLEIGGLRIEAVTAGRKRGLPQNGGYIEAFDPGSGKPLWLLRVYAIDYDPRLEQDVQDRYIAKLEPGDAAGQLLVTDEDGARFQVDLGTRRVTPLAAPGRH
jgi:hypothetical protein